MNALVTSVQKWYLRALRQRRHFPVNTSMVPSCFQSTGQTAAARLPRRVTLSAGKRYAWCACGHSQKQPFCDGAHRTNAPSIAPLRFTPDKDRTVMLCACKQTKNAPYCDGTHFKVIWRDIMKKLPKPKIDEEDVASASSSAAETHMKQAWRSYIEGYKDTGQDNTSGRGSAQLLCVTGGVSLLFGNNDA